MVLALTVELNDNKDSTTVQHSHNGQSNATIYYSPERKTHTFPCLAEAEEENDIHGLGLRTDGFFILYDPL